MKEKIIMLLTSLLMTAGLWAQNTPMYLYVGEEGNPDIYEFQNNAYYVSNLDYSWEFATGLDHYAWGTTCKVTPAYYWNGEPAKVKCKWWEYDNNLKRGVWREHSWAISCKDNPIKLSKTEMHLKPGDMELIDAGPTYTNFTYYDGHSYKLEYYSQNTNVAVIDLVFVKAVAPGTAQILVSSPNAKDNKYITVYVSDENPEPTKIDVSPESKTIEVNESFTCTYTLTPSNASTTVSWTSDNSNIATVNSSGKVTGVSAGTTWINATTANGKKDQCKVTVNPPIPDPGIETEYQLSAGGHHTMILKNDGSLWACGDNYEGQFGNGDWFSLGRSYFTKVMENVAFVSAGEAHTMIIKKDGSLWACGWNQYGQLGIGTTSNRETTPVKVMDGVSFVSAGNAHTMIIKTDGSLWACGSNSSGQLGDGTKTDRKNFVKIMDDVASVSAGSLHSMIIKTNGSLWTCGHNVFGQLGDGTGTDRSSPVRIMDGVSSVSAAVYHSMILKTDGSLWTCGNNDGGRLGDGTTTTRYTPVKVMDGVASISAGSVHNMILKTDRSLWANGKNTDGQLGDGTTTNRLSPVKVMDGVASVSAGDFFTMIQKTDGTLWACGDNEYGQLGDGTNVERHTPVKVLFPQPKLALSASPSGGQVSAGTNVYLTAKAEGNTISDCDIYYTLNGNDPTTSSTKYTSSGITINSNCTLKAIAYKAGYETSEQLKEVYSVSVEPTSIDVSPSSKSIEVGETFTCTYTLTPSNATTTVTWTSDDSSVATVNSSGKVTGVSAGTTWINATTANGKKDWCKVTVNAAPVPVDEISLWLSTTVHLDGTKKLTPTITPSDANPTLTWTSSDTSVATVNQEGVVTGKKLGTARITVKADNGKSDYCDIKVVKIFTAQTAEGKTMTFQVLSETDKTCQAGEDPTRTDSNYQVTTWAVGRGVTGDVTIPSMANEYTVTGIGGLAFLNNSISSVNIPSTVKSIGMYAFQGCENIESMVIPNSVTSIEKYALSKCSKLNSITLPNSITILNEALFWKDEALASVTIPSSVEKIDWSVFDNSGLKEVSLPNSITSIGKYAFKNCYGLEKVTTMISEPFEVDVSAFENEDSNGDKLFTTASLYVPKGTKAAYESTAAWNMFNSIIELEGGTVTPTDISQYANIVYAESSTASPESTFTLPVKMKNASENIMGFQFDLVLPAGVSVPKDEDGFYMVELSTDRTNSRKHTVTSQLQSDGSLRIVCYSNNNSTFSGLNGNVLNLTLQTSASVVTGELPLTLRNVVMTTPTMDSYTVEEVVCRLTIEDYMKGDVNGDKQVNVVDVAGVVNLILGSGDTAQLNRQAADINGDGTINVVDVAGVVSIILGNPSGARTMELASEAGKAAIFVDDFFITPGETKTVSVNLSNLGDSFTGCQFDLYLPEGISIAEEGGFPLVDIGSRSNARKHTVSASPQADGSTRIVCYSNSNSTFSGESGEILIVTLQASEGISMGTSNLYLRNITLSRPDVTGATIGDHTTKINAIPNGVDFTIVDSDNSGRNIYNLKGQKMQKVRKGINIIDGRMKIVK